MCTMSMAGGCRARGECGVGRAVEGDQVPPHHTPSNYEYFNELLPQAAANQNIPFDCAKLESEIISPKIENEAKNLTKKEEKRQASAET